jgi:hypothetical protein
MIIASSVFLIGGTLMTAAMGNLNMIYAGRAVAYWRIIYDSACIHR